MVEILFWLSWLIPLGLWSGTLRLLRRYFRPALLTNASLLLLYSYVILIGPAPAPDEFERHEEQSLAVWLLVALGHTLLAFGAALGWRRWQPGQHP